MMKGKLVYLLGTMTLSLSIIGFLLAILSASAATPSITSNTAWIDNFDNTTLNGRWSWVREDPTHWDLTSQPGYLHLVTKGSLFQTSNNLQNILTTPANGDNFQLITRVTISPTENYQSAGLLVYQDDDNYIEVSRVYNNGGKVRIRSEVGGATTSIYVDEIIETVYLRIDKEADRYLGFYSLDGNNWTHIGQYTVTLTSPYIGITAGNQPTMAEVNAYFNFVQYTPVEYNHTWRDNFDEPTINPLWSWVREDPTHWSLTDHPGFMHIVSQQGGLWGTANYMRNLLLTSAPAVNYRITTRVTVSPTENYQNAALYVYQDDDNYIRFSFGYVDGLAIGWRSEISGTSTTKYTGESSTTIYLRIDRQGISYIGYYSSDGNNWKFAGQTLISMTNPKMGIGSESGPTTAETPTDYDFFQLDSSLTQIFLPVLVK